MTCVSRWTAACPWVPSCSWKSPGVKAAISFETTMMHEEIARNTGSAALLARVQELIGAELRDVEQFFLDEVGSRHPFVSEVLEHMAGYRGKRLRPVLLLLSGLACGGLEQ